MLSMNTKEKKKTNIMDMTVGSPTRHLLLFSIPLLIGNVFQQFYNLIDSLIVGNYVGADALAAVGTCGSMSFLFFSLSSGLAIGIGILVAQYFGAKDESKVRDTIANSIYVLLIASILTTVLALVFAPSILRLLQTPDHILGDSVIYMRYTCLGILAISIYNGVAAILRALGDSKTPLYFLIVASVVNVVLDLFFVLYMNLAVLGVALATLISQIISAVTIFIYAYTKISYFRLTKEEMKPNKDTIIKTFQIGVPVALQNSLIAFSMMALQGVVNTFGSTVMAAYTVVSRVEQLVQQPYQSLSNALTNYSGQNYGACDLPRVKKGFRVAVLIAFIFSILLIPIAYIFGSDIVGFFVKEPEVIAIGTKALRINSLFYFALGMIYVPRAVLNGCGDTVFAMINGVCEVVCRIVFSQVLTRIPAFGFMGIWVTTGLTWTFTAICCLWRYFKGKWRNI